MILPLQGLQHCYGAPSLWTLALPKILSQECVQVTNALAYHKLQNRKVLKCFPLLSASTLLKPFVRSKIPLKFASHTMAKVQIEASSGSIVDSAPV